MTFRHSKTSKSTKASPRIIGDVGSAALEFALIVPLLIVLVFALIDFGRIGFVQISVISAAREGARYSSLYSTGFPTGGTPSLTDFNNFVQATAPSASSIAQLTSPAQLTVSVSQCSDISNENTSVSVSTPFKWLLPFGLLNVFGGSSSAPGTMNISATGVMRCTN